MPIANETAGEFGYKLPEGVDATKLADGRIELTQPVDWPTNDSAVEAAVVVGYFEAPWAVDGAGNALETAYQLDDGVVTQTVRTDESTVYPVVADPQFVVVSLWQVRLRWNRAETSTIASGGWAATGVTAVCATADTAAAGPGGAAALGAACLAASGSAVYTAGVAQNSRTKACLEMYATYVYGIPPFWVPWFGTHTGGSCV